VKKPSKLGESLISLAAIVENEHKRLLARKSIIEKRKEELERQILEKVHIFLLLNTCSFVLLNFLINYFFYGCYLFQEKEEEKKRMSSQKKTVDEERVRLLNEQRQREQDRIRREIEEKNKAEAKKMLEDLNKAGKKHVVVEGVSSYRLMVLFGLWSHPMLYGFSHTFFYLLCGIK
jgi:translation initiation factor 3 subunit A